jgi:hypothetical protein
MGLSFPETIITCNSLSTNAKTSNKNRDAEIMAISIVDIRLRKINHVPYNKAVANRVSYWPEQLSVKRLHVPRISHPSIGPSGEFGPSNSFESEGSNIHVSKIPTAGPPQPMES